MRRDKWYFKLLFVWVVLAFIVQGVGLYRHNEALKWIGLHALGLGALAQYIMIRKLPYDPERWMQIQLRVPGLSEDRSSWPSGECDLVLQSAGKHPTQVITALTRIYLLDIKDADEIATSTPTTLKEGISFAEAEFVKARLEAAGAQVDIRPIA